MSDAGVCQFMANDHTSFDRHAEIDAESPTMIEGLPGHGLVASIAVDRITSQLELDHVGSIHSEDFPPVATFNDGRVRDLVRVYAGADPGMLTLQSDLPIPSDAYDPLGTCILEDLTDAFDQAIFLAGVPATDEEEHGDVTGLATTDQLERDLHDADVTLAEGSGVVGGVTGALVHACYHGDIPAAVLVVKSNPYLPDPAAARALIENALEPLVDFDIDTTDLQEQAGEIRRQKQQIARQLKQSQETESGRSPARSMYQ